jgi:poly(3-hydroxybutyrate) depolymerase
LSGGFDVSGGDVPLDASGVGELAIGLPSLVGPELATLEDTELGFDVRVAGRSLRLPFYPRRAVRDAVARADRALAAVDRDADRSWLFEGSKESVEHLRDRLVAFVAHGDSDVDAQTADARELDELATSLEARTDPYARRSGAMRRAYRSPADGLPSEFGLYVPPAFTDGDAKPDKTYPLIVALHGMNGFPMTMLRWLFGFDDPGKDAVWEDRHPVAQLPRLDAFVVAPDGHGNAMYRDLGEADVMRVVEWAMRRYPIDPARVTITGPSMGGIGTAAIAFRYPSVFAAAEPLCGYHSYWIRRDIAGLPMRPWERVLADERSNTSWAYNGLHIPLYIVHGTKDLPEENSGVLVEKYKALGYAEKDEHPDEGHNVWQKTYEGLKGAHWLTWFKKRAHPTVVHFRTVRPRYGDSAWVHVEELAAPDAWGEVTAQVKGPQRIEVATKGVRALRLDRDAILAKDGDRTADVTVAIDHTSLSFGDEAPIEMHLEGAEWRAGPAPLEGAQKHGDVAGPLRDIFHGPVLLVYGASDPTEARANEEVARRWAHLGWGVRVDYPVMSDVEFEARGESLANDAGLFLVGSARTNRLVRALEPDLPIRIDGDAVVLGTERVTGDQVGAAFIRPNPRRPDRYVVVVEGVDALGTFRSLSLPSLLPDFVVYDARVAPARGQMLLGAGMVRAGGFFGTDWSLPSALADPLAAADRPGAKNEHDATPYLP